MPRGRAALKRRALAEGEGCASDGIAIAELVHYALVLALALMLIHRLCR